MMKRNEIDVTGTSTTVSLPLRTKPPLPVSCTFGLCSCFATLCWPVQSPVPANHTTTFASYMPARLTTSTP